jgi:hypothetical protein
VHWNTARYSSPNSRNLAYRACGCQLNGAGKWQTQTCTKHLGSSLSVCIYEPKFGVRWVRFYYRRPSGREWKGGGMMRWTYLMQGSDPSARRTQHVPARCAPSNHTRSWWVSCMYLLVTKGSAEAGCVVGSDELPMSKRRLRVLS